MNVCHTLICFFFLTLHDGNTGLINAEVITAKEGGNFRYGCLHSSSLSGKTKFFCKEQCKGKNILVDTIEDRYQSGRYSIEYMKGNGSSSSVLYVSIRDLTQSDSGRYRCSPDQGWSSDPYEDFELRVEVAPTTSKPNWTLRPSSTSVPSASTTQSLSSSSGGSTPSSASPEATTQSEQKHTPAAGTPLYVGLTLVIMVIVLSATVLIICWRRARKRQELPVETEYAYVTEENHEYEEIREKDGQSTSPPVQVSTVYTCAKYTKPNAAESSDEYSLVTAVSSQETTEDDSNKLIYSEVDSSNEAAVPFNSAPCGDVENDAYSVLQVDESSSSSHDEDASPPLYSTATEHQLCQ